MASRSSGFSASGSTRGWLARIFGPADWCRHGQTPAETPACREPVPRANRRRRFRPDGAPPAAPPPVRFRPAQTIPEPPLQPGIGLGVGGIGFSMALLSVQRVTQIGETIGPRLGGGAGRSRDRAGAPFRGGKIPRCQIGGDMGKQGDRMVRLRRKRPVGQRPCRLPVAAPGGQRRQPRRRIRHVGGQKRGLFIGRPRFGEFTQLLMGKALFIPGAGARRRQHEGRRQIGQGFLGPRQGRRAASDGGHCAWIGRSRRMRLQKVRQCRSGTPFALMPPGP